MRAPPERLGSFYLGAEYDLFEEELKPRRIDVNVHLMALAWLPFWLIYYKEGKILRTINIRAYPDSKVI